VSALWDFVNVWCPIAIGAVLEREMFGDHSKSIWRWVWLATAWACAAAWVVEHWGIRA